MFKLKNKKQANKNFDALRQTEVKREQKHDLNNNKYEENNSIFNSLRNIYIKKRTRKKEKKNENINTFKYSNVIKELSKNETKRYSPTYFDPLYKFYNRTTDTNL